MFINLENKHALVCGGSKGIGRAAAFSLAACGAQVTIAARDATLLDEVIHSLPRPKNQAHQFLVVDFNDSEDLKKKIHSLILNHHIEILINNTGGPPAGLVHLATVEQFESAFKQHLISNQILVQAVIPGMKENQYGRIINVISTSVKQPLDNLGVSNTIRGAVANWAKTLSNELAPFQITVNNILPGATLTDRLQQIIQNDSVLKNKSPEEVASQMKQTIPMARFGKPEEIAAAIAFLASPLASYITGINFPVDGGRTKSL